MKFKITDGLNKISIASSDICSYYRIESPVAVTWNDCKGSVGKYLALLPLVPEKRQAVQTRIMEGLTTDFTGKLDELHTLLQPLLQLFENGDYELHFTKGSTKKEVSYFSNGEEKRYTPDWQIEYGHLVDNQHDFSLLKEYQEFVHKNNFKEFHFDLVDNTTANIYNWGSDVYFATEPEANLDLERIRFFEREIQNGKRPFAILFSANFDETETYILDGHHKLAAYRNLNIQPALATIIRTFDNEEPEFDIETLAEGLYPWQFRHLLEYWGEKTKRLPVLMQNPASILHKYVRHGKYKEYHENGKLKHLGYYVYDRPDGMMIDYYSNGEKWREEHYHNGRPIGTWKRWYESGQLMATYSYDENSQLHGPSETWLENGRLESKHVYEHNQPADGYGFRRWRHSGKMQSEWWYKDGQLVERKDYGYDSELVSHQKYSENEKAMLPQELPSRFSDSEFMRDMKSIDWKQFRFYAIMIIVMILCLLKLIKDA